MAEKIRVTIELDPSDLKQGVAVADRDMERLKRP